jgi:hypothetical protein
MKTAGARGELPAVVYTHAERLARFVSLGSFLCFASILPLAAVPPAGA